MEIKNTSIKSSLRVFGLVYGASGVGKTSLCNSLEKTLIISSESGLLSLSKSSIDYVEVTGNNASSKLASLRECVDFAVKSDYETLFIDSLTDIASIMVDYQFDLIGGDKSKTLQVWGDYNKMIKKFIKTLRDCNKNIWCTALEKVETDDFQRRHILPDMQGSIARTFPQFFDEVFNYRIVEKKRILLTSAEDGVIAKDRSGSLNKFESPNLGEVMLKIKGGKDESESEETQGS